MEVEKQQNKRETLNIITYFYRQLPRHHCNYYFHFMAWHIFVFVLIQNVKFCGNNESDYQTNKM